MGLPTSFSWTLTTPSNTGLNPNEKLATLPHDFDFIEDNRAALTFSGTRLDPKLNQVVLVADSNGNFPITGDQFVISPMYSPKAVRQWVGFQVDIKHVFDGPDIQLTDAGYRLGDGTTQYFWNGTAWAAASTQWNTEADVANNIATFPTTARQIQVAVKLSTTSKTVTPILYTIHLAWVGKVEAFEDIVYRSLVPLMRTVRTISDFAIKVPIPGGLQLDVMSKVKASGLFLNVVGVEAVFNNNIDPDHYNNLLSSYNQSTGIATLTTSIPVGQYAFCRLVLQPQVAVESTAQDYIEVEAVPALQITGIQAVDSQPLSVSLGVTNKATGDIIVFQPPYRFNLRFTMIALTPGGVDLMRILRAIVELVENNQTITSTATDEQYRLWMIDEFTQTTTPQSNNLQSMQASFEIMDILAFEKPAQFTKAVGRVNLTTQA